MKVGSIVYATQSGLGILAKEFYDAGIINSVLIEVENNKGLETNLSMFPGSPTIGPGGSAFTHSWSAADDETINNFLDSIDVFLAFEIPFYAKIIDELKTRGKPFILMPMYECTPPHLTADLFLAVSDLDKKYINRFHPNSPVERINVPAHSKLTYRERSKAKIFVHNDGNGSSFDRNGTRDLLAALPYVQSPIKLLVRSQKRKHFCDDPRVEVINESLPFDKLWSEGDMFIFPERFNGLSLPIQEAYASGMPVMCGNRFPLNQWLPKDLLINIKENKIGNILPNVPFNYACYDHKVLANHIDLWYDKDISSYSRMGKEWASQNSWDILRPQYLKILKGVIDGKYR